MAIGRSAYAQGYSERIREQAAWQKDTLRFVSQQLPLRSTATLAALPAMSLVPLAPFAKASA